MSEPDLVEVRMIGIPVELWQRASSHHDAINREFEIMRSNQPSDSVPNRLLALISEFDARFGDAGEPTWDQLRMAAQKGELTKDLTFRVPAEAAPAARRLASMLAEVDEYCRTGEHLLTLAAAPEIVAIREWILGEFSNQIESGEDPTSWGDFTKSLSLEAPKPQQSVNDNTETVVFTGPLDLATAGELRDTIQERRSRNVRELVLDLSNVGLVDSIGIGLLVTTHNRLTEEGAMLRLIASSRLQDLLRLSGLLEILKPEDPPGA